MKRLLTIAFIITALYACSGEPKLQDKTPTDVAPHSEQSAVVHEVDDQMTAENNQADSNQETEQNAVGKKTGSAIRMVMGLATSMY